MDGPKSPEFLTVGALRKYLDEWEASWTELDTEVMGRFEDTFINCWPSDKGICKAMITYDGGLDFIIMEKDSNLKYVCHVDSTRENPPQADCVIDTEGYSLDDCCFAKKGMRKEECVYWMPMSVYDDEMG